MLVGLVPSLVGAEESGVFLFVYAVFLLYIAVFGYLGYRWVISLRTGVAGMPRPGLLRLFPLGLAGVLALAYVAVSSAGGWGELPLTQGGAPLANPVQVFVLLALVVGLAAYWWLEPRPAAK